MDDMRPVQRLLDGRVQPWVHPDLALTPENRDRRRFLLSALANSELGTVERRVAYLLQRYPETRDSHTHLAVRYWQRFQAEIIEGWDRLNLEVLLDLENFENIERAARYVQNDLRLWPGSEWGKRLRSAKQMAFHEYFAAAANTEPEVRFYLDETGRDGKQRYLAVAGICVMNWRQYERHHAALQSWRSAMSPATLHATDGSQHQHHLNLLRQLDTRKGGLLFVAHAMASHGATDRNLLTLFVQLVLDSLRCLQSEGCLTGLKPVCLVKERDDNFDSVYLRALKAELAERVAAEFLDTVYVRDVQAVPKGREVMLEVADQIAWGIQRRAAIRGADPKDELAEAVMNVTGFEDSREPGVLLRVWPAV